MPVMLLLIRGTGQSSGRGEKEVGEELPAWRLSPSCPLGLHLDQTVWYPSSLLPPSSPTPCTLKIAGSCPRSPCNEAGVSFRPGRASSAAGGTSLLQVDIQAPPTQGGGSIGSHAHSTTGPCSQMLIKPSKHWNKRFAGPHPCPSLLLASRKALSKGFV